MSAVVLCGLVLKFTPHTFTPGVLFAPVASGHTHTLMLASATLTGSLFRYKADTWPAPLQAFESPATHSHAKYVVYVGGLTDGLLACAYVEALGHELDRRGWALVQPLLSSSYAGFGCSSLERDATELAQLLTHIKEERPVEAFAIVGHSTGCQDSVTLLGQAPPDIRRLIRAAVLQAPVSDREAATLFGDDEARLKDLRAAQALVAEGKGNTLMPDMFYGFVPITASRYASLVGRLGPDDMFSSDFTDEQLAAILSHMGTRGQHEGRSAHKGYPAIDPVPDHPGLRTLFVHSQKDEYVPPAVDVSILSKRFVIAAGGAANGAAAYIVPEANHNLARPPTALGDFVERVGLWLAESV